MSSAACAGTFACGATRHEFDSGNGEMSEQSIYTRLLFGLAGHSYRGLRLQQVAEGIGESPSTTLRNLQRMEDDGLVERSPHDKDNWRLTPRVVQIAIAHADEVMHEERQLDQFRQRYSRQPT